MVGENDSLLLRWNMVFNKDCWVGNQDIHSWPGSATDLLWDLGASHFTSLDLSLFAKKKKWGLYQCQDQQAPEGDKMSGNQALDLDLHDSGDSSPPSAEDTPSGLDTATMRLFSTVVTSSEIGSTL